MAKVLVDGIPEPEFALKDNLGPHGMSWVRKYPTLVVLRLDNVDAVA